MAKFRLNPELVKLLIPVVIPFVEDLVKRTESTVDDRLVEVLKTALSNPVILAMLLSLLEGDAEAARSLNYKADNDEGDVLAANADLLCGLFSTARL